MGVHVSIGLVIVEHRNKAARRRSLDGSQRLAGFLAGSRQIMVLNQIISLLLLPSVKSVEQRLADLNLRVLAWIKQFKRGLIALKIQNEEALGLSASVEVSAPLQR